MGLFDALMPKKGLKFATKEIDSKKTIEKSVQSEHRNKVETHKVIAFQRNEKTPVSRPNKLGVCIPEHAKNRTETFSYDPNVCIPIHARPAEERRKLRKVKDVSPFEKLKLAYDKEESDFEKELDDLSAQAPTNQNDEDNGVESVEQLQRRISFDDAREVPQIKPRISIDPQKKAELEAVVRGVMYGKGGAENPRTSVPLAPPQKKEWGKAMPAFSAQQEEEPLDEIEESIEKVEGYIPKFSNTARKKFELNNEARAVEPKGFGTFEVTGVYQGGDTTIISGRVTSGKITARLTAQKGNISIKLNELKCGLDSVGELREGDQGSLFARGSVGAIRNGDLIDFS